VPDGRGASYERLEPRSFPYEPEEWGLDEGGLPELERVGALLGRDGEDDGPERGLPAELRDGLDRLEPLELGAPPPEERGPPLARGPPPALEREPPPPPLAREPPPPPPAREPEVRWAMIPCSSSAPPIRLARCAAGADAKAPAASRTPVRSTEVVLRMVDPRFQVWAST
jgi:hypothetical protein